MNDTILGLPINRFVVFVKPLINLAAGATAAWLVAKVQLLGILGVGQEDLATQIAAGLTGLLVTGVLQIADLKWIKGHHIELENGGIVVRDDDLSDDTIPDEFVDVPDDDPKSNPADQGESVDAVPKPPKPTRRRSTR